MDLNHSQKLAAEHGDGPCVVLAGPGSGKTAVITQRTCNLIRMYGVKPEHILVITYTKAAASEMRSRFFRMLPTGAEAVTFGTFHAVFFRVLKLAYHMSSANVVSEEMRYRKMRELLSKYPVDFRDEKEMIQGLLGEISLVKNARLKLENFYSGQCGQDVFRSIFREYERWLRDNRRIDFDDMLTYTYELFAQRKDILAAWQKKYQYILIDEFQDINPIQYEIMRMLALPENNLFVVGDDDQSIYRFRGAKPEIMLGFERDYPNAGKITLEENYRSNAHIVKDALRLIGHNKARFSKDIRPVRPKGRPVDYPVFDDQKQENLYVLKRIEQGIQNGRRFSDHAVLFRTNVQPRGMIDLLMRFNLPFQVKDHVPDLFEHWITEDILTYIRCAMGSRSRKDFLKIMNRPKRYIGRDSLCEETVAFDEWIKRYEEQPWIAERIEKLEADLRLLKKMSPYAAINYIRKGIGYEDFLEEYADHRGMNPEELGDTLEEIHATAKGFKTYEKWMEYMKEYSRKFRETEKRGGEEADAITLLTLHSAKGLEFPCVFLLDACEGIMPFKKAALEQDIEEERRMFYVGMTRAIEELTVCSVKSIRNKARETSRFVHEAGKED